MIQDARQPGFAKVFFHEYPSGFGINKTFTTPALRVVTLD
jgi:hypothetical protein